MIDSPLQGVNFASIIETYSIRGESKDGYT
jgi:hypothetical protein